VNQKLDAEGSWVDQVTKKGLSGKDIVENLYLSAYSRYPTEVEQKEAVQLLDASKEQQDPGRREAVEDFAWAVLTSKEFVFNH